MPIYAYKCEACGFAKDVLQKMSDAPLTECPACGQPAFRKQLTAAGFQLKGSGWYVTDFKGNGAPAGPAADKGGDGTKSTETSAEKPAITAGSSDSASKSSDAPPAKASSTPSSSSDS
jgi:putative FmdB family regulatory protein